MASAMQIMANNSNLIFTFRNPEVLLKMLEVQAYRMRYRAQPSSAEIRFNMQKLSTNTSKGNR